MSEPSSSLFDEGLIRAIVSSLCGEVATLRPIITLDDRVVCEVVADGRSVYFKASTSDPIALEAWAYRSAHVAGVVVPEVLAVDSSLGRFPAGYLVVDGVSGEEMASLDADDPLYRLLAEDLALQLRSLHAVTLEGFGLVDLPHFTATGQVRGSFATWSSYLARQVAQDLEILRTADIVSERIAASLRDLTAEIGPMLDAIVQGRQLHGDLGSEHVYVDRTVPRVVGLIDFADLIVGDPAYELARFDVWHVDYRRRRSLLIDAYAADDKVRDSLSRGWLLYTAIQFAANARFAYQRTGDPRGHNVEGLTRAVADADGPAP